MHRKLKSNVRVIVFESIFLSKGYPGELHVLSPKGIELKREVIDYSYASWVPLFVSFHSFLFYSYFLLLSPLFDSNCVSSLKWLK